MPEDPTPPAGDLDPDANAPDPNTPGAGDEPGDKGNKPDTPIVGSDTKLPSDFMGGKYETLGDFEKAHKAVQGDNTRMRQAAGTDKDTTPAEDPDKDKPITRGELDARDAEKDRLKAEGTKFDTAVKGLDLTEVQKVAAKAYGNLETNKDKAWPDILIALGHTTQDRVDKAKGLGRDEQGNSKILDPSNKALTDMTPAEVAALSPEKFEKLSNAQAKKEREEAVD